MKAFFFVLSLLVVAAALLVAADRYNQRNNHPVVVHQDQVSRLAVRFAHEDHVEQNCVACHHNYVDTTGIGLCFECHMTDPTISDEIEPHFHELCRTCHVEAQQQGKAHGPTRACKDCHQHDEAP